MKLTQTLNDAGVIDGILMWITVAILLIVLLPVMYGVIQGSPQLVTNSMDVGNLSGGGGVLTRNAVLNTTQGNMITMVGSSYGLLIVALIVIAAVVILGVVAYLRAGRK